MYETVIGLEVHLQLDTKSKAFCGCSAEFGREPNSLICPVCLGLPGALPVLNRQAFEMAIKVGTALNCNIAALARFDRKNYFYPDMPKNYQISQFAEPIACKGYLDIPVDGSVKRIGIRRVHLEEDTGKLLHEGIADASLVDFNRAGVALLEIVTEPNIHSPQEAYTYLISLKSILEYLEVSDCNMEEGSLRCDANISARPIGEKTLGTKAEIKNMNSFKAVRQALEFEAQRQRDLLKDKKEIIQETRLWDDKRQVTSSMRSKEEAHDYRYFPDPDLVPFELKEELVARIREGLPELPEQRKQRYISKYGLSEYDAKVLIINKKVSDIFDRCVKEYPDAKTIANWLIGAVFAYINMVGEEAALRFEPSWLVRLIKLVENKIISKNIAKDVFIEMVETSKEPEYIVKEKNLSQISDTAYLEEIIERAISANPKSVEDYRKGKEQALMFLVGQTMKLTEGRTDGHTVKEILIKKLRS